MKSIGLAGALAPVILALAAAPLHATGLATCQSGGQDGCYEVYALDGSGKRVEAYFHPRTLAPVPAGSKDHKG